jgi:hypothetical protein
LESVPCASVNVGDFLFDSGSLESSVTAFRFVPELLVLLMIVQGIDGGNTVGYARV